MLLTLAEVKAILGITDDSRDEQIIILNPIIERQIVDYLNNRFESTPVLDIRETADFYSKAEDFDGTGNAVLRATDTNFEEIGFKAGMDIEIRCTGLNDGFYRIVDVDQRDIEIHPDRDFISQRNVDLAKINMVLWPDTLKLTGSKMVDLNFEGGTYDVQSEKVGNYSVTYGAGGGQTSYPRGIQTELNIYRKIKFVPSYRLSKEGQNRCL